FAPVARIEAIRLFLAYASFMGFIMYQMDVNSAFLYGIIEEEVYVCQPPGFEDPQFPDKVYKVGKALYGLHQAPKAWYETLSTYFLENGFRRGTIDKILFIKKDKNDAQEIPYEFYVGAHILPRIIASTPMEPNKALVKDEEAKNVDVHLYRLKIGSLMYLTASRPDITFAICACARDSPFDLEDFSDSDYAGASLDIKSTTGEWMEGTGKINQSLFHQLKKNQTPRQAKRGRDTKIPQFGCPPKKVGDKAIHKESGDRMERAATTASSLEAEQDSDVPKIFMQQFWYTIQKVQDTNSYEFLLANKKCIVNAEVFRTILDICPIAEGVDFTDVPDDDTALTFVNDLGYKGLLNRNTNMFVDHMHQLWRTLAAIINKCLSRKTTSNDKLKKSRIDILWGMFNRENVNYLNLIWEDFAYQIDHKKEKRSRHDGIVSRLKFIRISEDYQEYGLPIPDVMLTNAIKHLESYQMFIKYSTYQILTKKSRGKGSKGKKTVDDSQETVDVSKESEPEPEPSKVKTSSKRRVKKKVILSADDNIISVDPDAALELAKSISQTKAEEVEAARKVHATLLGSLRTLCKLLRKVKRQAEDNLVLEAQMKELGDEQDSDFSDDDNDDVEKDDKDGDADDEGDDHVSYTQDADDKDDKTESDEDKIYKYKIRVCKDKDVEMKDVEGEESDKGKEKVTNAAKEEAEKTLEENDDANKTKLPPSSSILSVSLGFGDQFLKLSSDSSLVSTVKDSADANVSSLLDIPIQHKTLQTQSPSVQKILISVIPETTNLPPIPEIVIETPVSTIVPSPQVTPIILTVQQTPTPIPTPPITTNALTIIIVVHESDTLSAVELTVAKLEKDVSDLKTVDHSSEALAVVQSQVPIVVDSYLDTKFGDFTIKSTDKAALEEYDLKSALYQSIHANKSFNRNIANNRLYHALIEALMKDENEIDKGVADTVKDHKRKHDDDEDNDDEDPLARPKQGKKAKRRKTKESESSKKPSSTKETTKGKAPTKGSKIGKSALANEPVEEPIAEVVMDDAGDDVARDDN
ncbi:retrovirus-related pol polyprotein from transposon TNT 1-94, partial [Tanacetum coccineum]